MHLLLPLALLLTVLGISGGSWYFWSAAQPALIPSGRFVVAFALLLGGAGLCMCFARKARPTLRDLAHPPTWALGLVLIFSSSWLCRPYSFFQGPWFRVSLVAGSVVALAMTFLPWRRILIALPILASLISIASFFQESAGRLLFSDDHAVFLFRLQLLKENFPVIPFWSPLWNAGFEARDFFATGALNAFLIASPLLYLSDVDTIYNVVIAGILWIWTPLCSYIAARKLSADKTTSAITATIAMSTSLFWYRWGLKYGTVGFIVSSSLIPLVVALAINFIRHSHLAKRDVTLLTISTTLMLLWSPSGLAIAPLAIASLPRLPIILRSRRHLVTIALIIALNVPWMTMMWKVSSVGKFLHSEAPSSTTQVTSTNTNAPSATTPASHAGTSYRHRASGFDAKKALKNWQEAANSANPLVVILGLPALLALATPLRRYYGALSLWLVGLGTFGVSLKPQLELDRMLVIAGIVTSLPIGFLITSIFQTSSMGPMWRATTAVVGGFLLASPLANRHMLRNDLNDTYSFRTSEVTKLAESIKSTSRGGRTLFTGNVLHQLDGGHLAPLPLWSNTLLIAMSYSHSLWKYEQPIPKSFMESGDEGIRRFFDLMNVSLVTAHEPTWRKYLAERPNEYEEIGHFAGFLMFSRRNITPSYAVEGSLRDLSFSTNSITFTPLTNRLVISFKYFPFLRSSGCTLQPFIVAPELQLIELTGCSPETPITIRSISPLERIQMGNS